MNILCTKMLDLYGKTDQDKEAERIAEEEAIKKAKEEENLKTEVKTKDAKPEDKKKEEPPPEPEIPSEVLLSWTGEITKGSLFMKLNPEKNAYTNFIFTKENPKLLETIAVQVEKARKEKTETDLQKSIEEYKGFIIK
jgi:hypothetical protein